MTPSSNSVAPTRFARYFPLSAALVLNPLATGAVALGLALFAGSFSIHYALAVIIAWLGLFAFYLERGLLNYILFPPFATVMAWQTMSLGLGISLVVSSSGGLFVREYAIMQGLAVAAYPLAYGAYRFGFGKLPRLVVPSDSPAFEQAVVRPLVALGWVLFGWRILQMVVLAATGLDDRGDYGINVMAGATGTQGVVFGVWTYFNFLPRLGNMAFLLFPLILIRARGLARAALVVLFSFNEVVGFASGARGSVMYPLFFVATGAFLFLRLGRFRLERWLIGGAVAIIPLITFMEHFRSTEAYRNTRTIDLIPRLKAVGEAVLRSREAAAEGGEMRDGAILGRAWLGVEDRLIYAMTPSQVPYAGFEGFEAILYAQIPTFVMRNKPHCMDSNLILNQYNEVELTSFNTISPAADCYRRFGWVGVPVGLAVLWYIYGWACGQAYKGFLFRNAGFGAILILYILTFFCGAPFGTVLTTWWMWTYELPKHLIVLALLYWGVAAWARVGGAKGALAYRSVPSPGQGSPKAGGPRARRPGARQVPAGNHAA